MTESLNATLTHSYSPRITFQDTNVVGNVYFLNYFRWQSECLEQWLHVNRPGLWTQLRSQNREVQVSHCSMRFEDPFGATIGDSVDVQLFVIETECEHVSASANVFRHGDDGPTRIASGNIKLTTQQEVTPAQLDYPTGPFYSFISMRTLAGSWNELELLGLQGKCRELFLADHAADTLRQVAQRELVLQTTTASLESVRRPPLSVDRIRVEMRLESLKCGQIGVRFDYFADTSDGTHLHFAKGHQKMSSKHQYESTMVPCPLPMDLLMAFSDFTEAKHLLAKLDDILTFKAMSMDSVVSAIPRTST